MNVVLRGIHQSHKSWSQIFVRHYTKRNILKLKERGFFQDVFPTENINQINSLLGTTQTFYAGFDPTANSLHVGNLLVIIGLLHCQRAGHNPIALIGGATGKIGDPSGKKTDREGIGINIIDQNIKCIDKQIKHIFDNHAKYYWEQKGEKDPLPELRIVNNADWYEGLKLIDFISTIGKNFRLGAMLSRASVQSRLQSEVGMSFTEFTYQIFQAFDWLHLHNAYDCRFQIGGSDQMGNMMSGHELISKVENKQVCGMTLPLITTKEGDKFGKSEGNAVWLDQHKTSPFSFYQFFVRMPDSEMEKLLKLLTFLSLDEIASLMKSHMQSPEKREAQKRLASELTVLIHGEEGLQLAETISEALYSGNFEALGNLDTKDLSLIFEGASYKELLLEPGLSVLDTAMKANLFPTQKDAVRIITAGGFYVNQVRTTNINEVISPGIHILKNKVSMFRVGKKNYHIVKWNF